MWYSLALVLFLSSPFLSSPSFLAQGAQASGCGAESSPLDLLALSFSEEAICKFIPPLSFLVLNLHLSANLTRLVGDTSGGHTEKSPGL